MLLCALNPCIFYLVAHGQTTYDFSLIVSAEPVTLWKSLGFTVCKMMRVLYALPCLQER